MLPTMYDSRNKKHLKTRNKKHLKTRNKKRSKNISRKNKKTKTRMRRKKYGGGNQEFILFRNKCIEKTKDIKAGELKKKLCGFFNLYNDVNSIDFNRKVFGGDHFDTPKLFCGDMQILDKTLNLAKNTAVFAPIILTNIIGWVWSSHLIYISHLLSQHYKFEYNNMPMKIISIISVPKVKSVFDKTGSSRDVKQNSIILEYNTAVFFFEVITPTTIDWVILYLYYNGNTLVLGSDNFNTFCDVLRIQAKKNDKNYTAVQEKNLDTADQNAITTALPLLQKEQTDVVSSQPVDPAQVDPAQPVDPTQTDVDPTQPVDPTQTDVVPTQTDVVPAQTLSEEERLKKLQELEKELTEKGTLMQILLHNIIEDKLAVAYNKYTEYIINARIEKLFNNHYQNKIVQKTTKTTSFGDWTKTIVVEKLGLQRTSFIQEHNSKPVDLKPVKDWKIFN